MFFEMVANPRDWGVDFAEYLRFERDAAERHELIDGQIVAMAGASRRHNVLCERLHDAIRPPLGDGPCQLHRSDMRLAVRTAERGWVAYYPDLAVYRSDRHHPQDGDTLVDPTVLVEVTSKSTEKNDRGVKLQDYLQIETLEEYVIVSHERRELEVWTKGTEGWTRKLTTDGTMRLSTGAELDVSRLYDGLPS